VSVSVLIDDRASPLISRITTAAQASGLALVGARAVAVQVRGHMLKLNQERSRKGVGRSFYGQAAKSVTSVSDGLGALVNLSQRGLRLRFLGGVVRPGPGKKLVAYPAADAPRQAYDQSPRAFNDLDLSRQINPAHGGLQLCLIRRASTPISFVRRKRKDGTIATRVKAGAVLGGEVVYWLAKKTTHRADPSVLPLDEAMQTTAAEGMRTHLLTQAQRNASSN